MENYLTLVFLLAPGFIAVQSAEWLGRTRPPESGLSGVMGYFTYSLFALFFSFSALLALGYVPTGELTTNYIGLVKTNADALKIAAVVIAASFFTGALWQAILKPKATAWLNIMNEKLLTGLHFRSDGVLYDSIGKGSLLSVKKDGWEISGLFLGMSHTNDKKREIALQTHPNFQGWIDYARANPDNPEGIRKQNTFIDFTDDFVVEEYCYRTAFFETGSLASPARD
jgi:hypothetical protein